MSIETTSPPPYEEVIVNIKPMSLPPTYEMVALQQQLRDLKEPSCCWKFLTSGGDCICAFISIAFIVGLFLIFFLLPSYI